MFSLNLTVNRLIALSLFLSPLGLLAQAEMMMRGPPVPSPIPPPQVKGQEVSRTAMENLSVTPEKEVSQNKENRSALSQEGDEATIQAILDFWLGSKSTRELSPQDKFTLWFGDNRQLGQSIRDRFGEEVLSAGKGKYNEWRHSPRGRLALILLLDTFPRFIYQGEANEFRFDQMARAIALEGLQKGDDRKLYPIERAFFYLPFEHSEDIEAQNLSVSLYEQLLADAPLELKGVMRDFLMASMRQREQIERFGRFPYRNALLGRESTPEEIIFLNQKTNKRI